MEEQQAIQRLKNGDIRGLEFLVVCHQVQAVRTAYLITQDLGLTENIVQDSFLRAFRAMRGFDVA
jgi:DNA-directed RNA polymerase specialized sigma24 family protein